MNKLLIVLLAISFQASADELHIIKNDGMSSHEVYKCVDTSTCYQLYKTKWFFDKNINCSTKMWIQRNNRVIMRLKGR